MSRIARGFPTYPPGGPSDRLPDLYGSISALLGIKPDGQFAFETRNPAQRAWLSWTPDATREVVQTTAQGRVEACYDAAAEAGADTGIVAIAQHCRFLDLGLDGGLARVGRNRIRFIERDHLAGLLARAGLVAAAWYGDWHRGAFTPTSKEIIAVTRRAG